MKVLKTRKEIKTNYSNIIKIGYCNAQYLLKAVEPFAYSTRTEGWACDYYNIDGVIISTGYAPIGESLGYEFIESYENKAREIWCNYDLDYETQKSQVDKLIQNLIKEATTNV